MGIETKPSVISSPTSHNHIGPSNGPGGIPARKSEGHGLTKCKSRLEGDAGGDGDLRQSLAFAWPWPFRARDRAMFMRTSGSLRAASRQASIHKTECPLEECPLKYCKMTTIPPTTPDHLEPAWAVARLFPAQGHWTDAQYLSFTESLNQLVEVTDETTWKEPKWRVPQ